jgi:hypothetical protein
VERRAWVSSADEREAVEATLHGMLGRAFLGVRYVELSYDGNPAWDAGTFHSIDFGVELQLDDGATWAVTWDQAGHNEGLMVYAGALASELRPDAEVATWDVTALWRDRFPTGFSGVKCVWTRHAYGPAYTGPRWETRVDDGGESDLCLVSVILAGDGPGQAVITLGESGEPDGSYGYRPDNVAVFFSSEEARRAGVLLPGDADAVA